MNAPVNVSVWDGINLLPWRLAAVRRLRRRRTLEWLAALLIGGVLGCAAAGWQMAERLHADARRTQIEQQLAQLGTPLQEARRLAREADERSAALREAQQKAKPLAHLFALIEALARVRTEGVTLDQLIQHADETELQASATDEAAAAAWLERLHTLREIESVNVREMKREAPGKPIRATLNTAPIHVAARLVWKGAATATGATHSTRTVSAKGAK